MLNVLRVVILIKWFWVMFLKKLWLNVKVYKVYLWRDIKVLSVFVCMGIIVVRFILFNMFNLFIFGSDIREYLFF